MIPKRIWLKNFLSFGEPAAEFVFADDEPLWVLCGPNGVGKSAVFDAITYALYGRHRGGEHKAEQLVRHGANGFEIEFDFEFNGIDYRIRRTRVRKKGGRTTQHLLKRVGGEWTCVRGNDPAGAVTADDIKEWVTDTLGLGYEAFTNSVLLRQGEADKLFSASRDDRIAVLKGIIGFEQFEALSERVHDAAAGHKKTAEELAVQLTTCQPVTDEEVKAAEQTVRDRKSDRDAAQEAREAAAQRVEQAKQWEKLEKQRQQLEQFIAEAKARAADSARIRADNDALVDLSKTVPVLEALFKVRSRMAGLQEKLGAARRALHIKELARDIKKGERLLIEVAEVECLEKRLKAFPDDLDARLGEATTAETDAEQAWGKARDAKTEAETLLKQARKRQVEFADVTVGVTCSRCGQLVDEAHAAKERARIADEVKTHDTTFKDAKKKDNEAGKIFADARERHKALEKSKTDRQTLAAEMKAKRDSLPAVGELTTAAALRARLADLRKQKAEAEGWPDAEEDVQEPTPNDAKRLEAERKKLDTDLATARDAADALKSDLAKGQGEEKTTLDRLSEPWKDQLPTLDATQVAELAAERDRLIADRVAEKFKALEQDDVKRAGWQEQLATIRSEIDDIPIEGRIPDVDAERHQLAAKASADQATERRDAAVQAHNDLAQRKQEYEQVTAAHREATERHRLHKKLDDLLGQVGLQRELVRDAEEQIVAFANETLQHLSDGDLALEEDTALESTKAFDLRVRRIGGEPIGVAFLSGSQRFRVAVSVALAVGRFASGRTRPLEGVIIDEGFGSLDRDGLRAMAEELKRLQRESALRRVVLVSHQPEFTDHFSVGYALAAGETGTTATPFRR
jgi:DNA repair exonuclease SbcCD ATPase subunit